MVADQVSEPSWARALKIVQSKLMVPIHVWKLVRAGWGSMELDRGLLDHIAQTSVGAGFVYDAAQPNVLGTSQQVVSAEQAIESLGPKLLSTILAINYTCRTILRYKPAPYWEKLFKEMATSIEVGSKIGARVPNIGVEGGMVIGFSRPIGLAFLLVTFPKEYRKWHLGGGDKKPKTYQREVFGTESYQIASFVMQQLGFGAEMSIGAALGQAPAVGKHLELTEETSKWKAVAHWIDALVEGKSYPANIEAREYFPELRVQTGKKNTLLEVLYTEVGRVQKQGSEWTWHLPRPGYEVTKEYMEKGEAEQAGKAGES